MIKKIFNILKVKVFFRFQLILLYILAIASTILFSYKYDSLIYQIESKYQKIEQSYNYSNNTKNNLFTLYITENSYLFDKSISKEVYYNVSDKYKDYICSDELDGYIEKKRNIKSNLRNKTYDQVSLNNSINKEILGLLKSELSKMSSDNIDDVETLKEDISKYIISLKRISIIYFFSILIILIFLSIDIQKIIRKFKGKKNVVDILLKDKLDDK